MGISEKKQSLENKPNGVRLKYVKLGYHYLISNAMYISLLPLILALAHLSIEDLVQLFHHHQLSLVSVTLVCTALTVCLATLYFALRPRDVYLLDFACFKPDPSLMVTREFFMKQSTLSDSFSEETLAFQRKILERAGYGQKTYAPEAAFEHPLTATMAKARKEVEMVMFGAIDQLLAKTGVNVKDIGILVVNCSLFNPTPSLSAMVVNRYKLRGNILSYNLGGMGCSAGVIAIDLAKRLLKVRVHKHSNTYFPI